MLAIPACVPRPLGSKAGIEIQRSVSYSKGTVTQERKLYYDRGGDQSPGAGGKARLTTWSNQGKLLGSGNFGAGVQIF